MLDTSQQAALDAITDKNAPRVSILTGGPGRGKTYTVEAIVTKIIALGKVDPTKIFFAAPTGKAAKVLKEYLNNSPLEVVNEPMTIHRLLGCAGIDWTYNEYNPLNADLLIIDEASMIPSSLMARVLRSISANCKIILVGDADQLPPVEAGCPFLDVVKSNNDKFKAAVSRLTINHRAAEGGMIAAACEEINAGKPPVFGRTGQRTLGGARLDDLFFVEREDKEDIPQAIVDIIQEWHTTGEDYQVLAPQRSGLCGVEALNKHLQLTLNPGGPEKSAIELGRDTILRQGDKVINTKNNYDLNIFNGYIGTILEVDPYDKTMVVDFDGQFVCFDDYNDIKNLQLGYAITIHNSQGSQYKRGVVVIHSSHTYMLSRSLLYVAVSRFKEELHVVGNKRALKTALRNNATQSRNTYLAEMLESEAAA